MNRSKDVLIGRHIRKKFAEEFFFGTVEDFGQGYYFVRYSDGDCEDLSKTEVKRLLVVDPPPWQIRERDNTFDAISEWTVKKITVEMRSKAELNFLGSIFKDGVITYNFNGGKPAKSTLTLDGKDYALFYAAVPDNEKSSKPWFRKSGENGPNFYYVATTDGPSMEPISLQDTLDKIANFGELPDFKRYARLKIFIKNLSKAPIAMKSDQFEIIDDLRGDGTAMGDGCGFFPDGIFPERMLRNKDAIQFRCFGPQIGMHKGLLCRKQGITKVQLKQSTQKVGPSLVCADDWVAFGSVSTTPSRQNKILAKFHSGKSPAPSFRQASLPETIETLMTFLQVPRSIIRKMESAKFRNYAWLRGLADPTAVESIPEGAVFIPGCTIAVTHVFVTRSPCPLPEDARLLPVVTSRPREMSRKDWAFLQSFSFGSIIFSTAGVSASLPSMCAEGDLDGDNYFVCFDKNVVDSVKVRPLPPKSLTGRNPTGKRKRCSESQWFAEHQRYILDNDFVAPKRLIGRIYREMQQTKEASREGMDDPDYRLLACAYKESIDTIKHQNSIMLPPRLQRRVGL